MRRFRKKSSEIVEFLLSLTCVTDSQTTKQSHLVVKVKKSNTGLIQWGQRNSGRICEFQLQRVIKPIHSGETQ